jgi:hypothetical protein
MDVTGGMRKEKVKLPTSILSSKPGALPNSQVLIDAFVTSARQNRSESYSG